MIDKTNKEPTVIVARYRMRQPPEIDCNPHCVAQNIWKEIVISSPLLNFTAEIERLSSYTATAPAEIDWNLSSWPDNARRDHHFSTTKSEPKNWRSAADSGFQYFCWEHMESRIGIDQSLWTTLRKESRHNHLWRQKYKTESMHLYGNRRWTSSSHRKVNTPNKETKKDKTY